MARHLEVYREHAPGFENAFLMLSAPQIGVRHAGGWSASARLRARNGRDGSRAPTRSASRRRCRQSSRNISVPYGALVPAELDGLLVAGRHIACDATSHTFLREIPQCWLTGQAAGVAAALAVAARVRPRAVSIGRCRQNCRGKA